MNLAKDVLRVSRSKRSRSNVTTHTHSHIKGERRGGGGYPAGEGSRDAAEGVVGLPGMSKAQLELEFPGCVVPDELVDGWWSEAQGCETVPQAQARVESVAAWQGHTHQFSSTFFKDAP